MLLGTQKRKEELQKLEQQLEELAEVEVWQTEADRLRMCIAWGLVAEQRGSLVAMRAELAQVPSERSKVAHPCNCCCHHVFARRQGHCMRQLLSIHWHGL